MNKLYPDAAAALDGLLFDGMHICAGGFGLCGIPERLIAALRDAAVRGEEVSLPGFGKFKVQNKPARQGRNPQTGETVQLAAS